MSLQRRKDLRLLTEGAMTLSQPRKGLAASAPVGMSMLGPSEMVSFGMVAARTLALTPPFITMWQHLVLLTLSPVNARCPRSTDALQVFVDYGEVVCEGFHDVVDQGGDGAVDGGIKAGGGTEGGLLARVDHQHEEHGE